MRKTTQAMLGVLLMITMSLSTGLEGMPVKDENTNHTSARDDTASPKVQLGVDVVDLDENPYEDRVIGLDDTFFLYGVTTDLRDDGDGVFAVYMDVNFSNDLVEVVSSEILHIDPYVNGRSGTVNNTVGVIDEVGGFAGIDQLGTTPRRFFRVTMRAVGVGEVVFDVNSADISSQHDVLVYGENEHVPLELIDFVDLTMQIVDPGSAPIITIVGDEELELLVSETEEYTDSGATCVDEEDGGLSHAVEVSGQVVNMRIAGTYWIAYNCEDSDGNEAVEVHRRVVVIEGDCLTNEYCTNGQYCTDENWCMDDPSQDDSCTSDTDCENGQICGAAGECMDAPDDSGNDTAAQEECAAGGGTWTPSTDSEGEYYCDMGSENETNDGGGEPQYRNCSLEDMWSMMGDVDMNDLELMVCDEETGLWNALEQLDENPALIGSIACDEEPTEEQLDASNFADLLNEHDEVLIRDGDVTRLLSTGKMNTSVTLSPFLIAKYELSQVGSNDSDGLEEWSIYLDLDLDTAVGGDGDFDWNDMTVVWHTMVTVITDDSDEDSEGRSNSTFTPKSETVYIISHSFLVSNSTGNDTEGVWGGSLSIEGIVSTGESGGAIIMQRTAIDTSGGGVDECGECWGMEVSIEPNDPDVGNIFLMEKVSYSSTMKSLGTTVITGGSLIIEDAIPWDESDDDGDGGEDFRYSRYRVFSSNFQFLYQERAEYERSEGRNSTNAIASPAFGSITIWFETSVSSWSNSSWDHGGGLNLPFTSISNGSGTLIADSYVIWSVNLGGENDGEDLNSENDPEWIYVSLGGTNDGNWMMSFGNASGADATVCEHPHQLASCNGSTVIGERTFVLLIDGSVSGISDGNDGGDGSDGDLYYAMNFVGLTCDAIDIEGVMCDDAVIIEMMVGGGASAFDQKLVAVNSFVMSVDGGFVFSENLMFADFDNGMRVESIQIDMDENGTVASAHKFTKVCLGVEDIESTNKDDGDEESSASGDVDITGLGDGADLAVVGGGALLAGIGMSSILGQTGRGGGGLGSSGASKRKSGTLLEMDRGSNLEIADAKEIRGSIEKDGDLNVIAKIYANDKL